MRVLLVCECDYACVILCVHVCEYVCEVVRASTCLHAYLLLPLVLQAKFDQLVLYTIHDPLSLVMKDAASLVSALRIIMREER